MIKTFIQWTTHTWNPWTGCHRQGPGCLKCYMFRIYRKAGRDPEILIRAAVSTFNFPLTIKENVFIFTCSMSDFFHEDADAWRAEAWKIIKQTPHITYQILTKRPQRILKCLPPDWGDGYPNVWLGVSGEDEVNVYKRVKILLMIPAVIHFLSAEPLLEEVMSDRNKTLLMDLDWIIIGGESGYRFGEYSYRKMELSWAQSIIDYGKSNGIAIFNKQVGSHYHFNAPRLGDWHGGDIDQWPVEWEYLKVREFPKFTPAQVIREIPESIQLKLNL